MYTYYNICKMKDIVCTMQNFSNVYSLQLNSIELEIFYYESIFGKLGTPIYLNTGNIASTNSLYLITRWRYNIYTHSYFQSWFFLFLPSYSYFIGGETVKRTGIDFERAIGNMVRQQDLTRNLLEMIFHYSYLQNNCDYNLQSRNNLNN